MSDIAITVKELGKKYLIRHQHEARRYKTVREAFAGKARALFAPKKPAETTTKEEFWALKEVSFDIKQGEAVGIIGRNGAGKSTLLKLLSRITEPTTGSIDLHGRVASLLEVGTGFHQELTGRENIYLNGSILGMSRMEVRSKFDEIVDFAEVEKFLDTPVKRYSSGMYMRLAFAVAAHLEPEILIVDEVLAVGDAAFQEKCLGKMGQVSSAGRTVLFVSHQINAIQSLCRKCILLREGQIASFGSTDHVIREYLNVAIEGAEWRNLGNTFANPSFVPTRMALIDESKVVINTDLENTKKVGILIEGFVESVDPALVVGFAVYAHNQLLFWSLQTDMAPKQWPSIKQGKNSLICWLPTRYLNEGDYRIELIVSLHYRAWICQPGVNSPTITLRIRGGLSDSPHWSQARPGLLAPTLLFHQDTHN